MINRIKVTIYTNRTEIETSFPARWAICQDCDGNGTSSRHIECDGGGFTASEWNEACGDDDDFAEDYFAGRYDRGCDHCKGSGKVLEIDYEAVNGWRQNLLLRAYFAQLRDSAEIDAMHAAERRMGA